MNYKAVEVIWIFLADGRTQVVRTFIKRGRGGGPRPFMKFIKKTDKLARESVPKFKTKSKTKTNTKTKTKTKYK